MKVNKKIITIFFAIILVLIFANLAAAKLAVVNVQGVVRNAATKELINGKGTASISGAGPSPADFDIVNGIFSHQFSADPIPCSDIDRTLTLKVKKQGQSNFAIAGTYTFKPCGGQLTTQDFGTGNDFQIPGRLAIGTTTYKGKLFAAGNIVAAGDIVLGNDVDNQRFILHSRASQGGDFLQITADDGNGFGQWGKGITFRRDTGNVGIGTTTPQSKLQVAGDLRVNNGATIGGNLDVTGAANVGGQAVCTMAGNCASAIPTLQSVTDAGAVTTEPVTINNDLTVAGYIKKAVIMDGALYGDSILGLINDNLVRADQKYSVQIQSGTILSGGVSNLFDADGVGVAFDKGNLPIIIIIDFGTPTHYWNAFAVHFPWRTGVTEVSVHMYADTDQTGPYSCESGVEWKPKLTQVFTQDTVPLTVFFRTWMNGLCKIKIELTGQPSTFVGDKILVGEIAGWKRYTGAGGEGGAYVKTTGDTVYGNLKVEGDLSVGGTIKGKLKCKHVTMECGGNPCPGLDGAYIRKEDNTYYYGTGPDATDPSDDMKSPNQICQRAFGNEYSAVAIDCEQPLLGAHSMDTTTGTCEDTTGTDIAVNCCRST